jgi:Skp family chaperone for outer membrane proteins
MARDDKKTSRVPKNGAAEKKEVAAKEDKGQPKDKTTPDEDRSKAESGEKAASSGYSRGEGQKPVSKAYRDNWNAIYAKKKKKKR